MDKHHLYPQRRAPRLPDYDYSRPGWYYVTICTQGSRKFFGDIMDSKMQLNNVGEAIHTQWLLLPERFTSIRLDEYIVMPNHMHGIILLEADLLTKTDQEQPSLGKIIRTFKAVTTRHIRTSGRLDFAWQARYYEHIIRNIPDLARIREYIVNNPARWTQKHLLQSGSSQNSTYDDM